MDALVITLICLLGSAVMASASYVGWHGWATNRERGYDVPEHVKSDPKLREYANRIVFRYCGLGAVVCLTPIVGMYPYLTSDFAEPSTWELVAVAATVTVATAIANYPLFKIKSLKDPHSQ